MKTLLILSIVTLSIVGCGSNDESTQSNNNVHINANNETLFISIDGVTPNMPSPSNCQKIILKTENALITYSYKEIVKKTNFSFLFPNGVNTSVFVTPNAGYHFDGWYCNGNPVNDMSIPFMSDPVIVNAVMIPIVVQ